VEVFCEAARSGGVAKYNVKGFSDRRNNICLSGTLVLFVQHKKHRVQDGICTLMPHIVMLVNNGISYSDK
jgi:hypothetical protein